MGTSRENPDVLRVRAYRNGGDKRRTFLGNISLRIFDRRSSTMRNQPYTVGRQRHEVDTLEVEDMKMVDHLREPLNIEITCTSRIRKWAYENAFTLIFLTAMFIITWIVIVVAKYAL